MVLRPIVVLGTNVHQLKQTIVDCKICALQEKESEANILTQKGQKKT